MDKLYTVDEIASALNVHANTVRIWLKNGTMKGIKVNRYWRVKENQLQEFIGKQEGESTSDK